MCNEYTPETEGPANTVQHSDKFDQQTHGNSLYDQFTYVNEGGIINRLCVKGELVRDGMICKHTVHPSRKFYKQNSWEFIV